VVRLIDGESTAADISAGAPAEAFAVEKLLAALVTLGLVHPAYAVTDEAAARPTIGVPPEEPEVPPDPDMESEEKEPAASVPNEEDEEDEELEPEVDIEDKVEESPSVSADDFDALGGEVRATEESSGDLVDADLGSGSSSAPEESPGDLDEAEEKGETEGERLAADLQAAQAAPDDFGYEPPHVESHVDDDVEMAVEADTHREPSSGTFDFQKPLDASTGVGSFERPRHRSSAALFVVLGLLVAATAAVLYWRSRGPAGGGDAQPVAVAAASPSPTFSETSIETPVPETPAAAAIPIATAPIAAPARAATATAVPSVRPTVVPSARPTARPARPTATQPRAGTQARPQSRRGWTAKADRDEKSASSDPNARFAVQLELACEIPSLTEAFAHDQPAGTMWVVKTSYRGRTCFRVLWGRYPDRESAERALSDAPSFFSTSRNHPMVVPVR
ncbi:MAG: hypothetical protein ABW056_04795, partial [Thermoanaerobaculia bacterium]